MPRRRTSRQFIVTAALVVAVVVLFSTGILSPITDPLVRATLSLAAPAYRVGVALTADGPEDLEVLEGEQTLDGVIEALRLENAKLANALERVDQLEALVAYEEREDDTVIPARVITERDGMFHGFTIDRGAEDDIVIGAPVLTADGVLIGKISEVRRLSSLVRSVTDSGSRLAVAIRNGSDTLGVLEGQRGLSMAISLIPQGEHMNPGDIVITSGGEPGVRRGIPIGIIEKVAGSTQDPFQTATVAPFQSAEQPVFVQIVLPDTEEASL